jgi:hypothetical protein
MDFPYPTPEEAEQKALAADEAEVKAYRVKVEKSYRELLVTIVDEMRRPERVWEFNIAVYQPEVIDALEWHRKQLAARYLVTVEKTATHVYVYDRCSDTQLEKFDITFKWSIPKPTETVDTASIKRDLEGSELCDDAVVGMPKRKVRREKL